MKFSLSLALLAVFTSTAAFSFALPVSVGSASRSAPAASRTAGPAFTTPSDVRARLVSVSMNEASLTVSGGEVSEPKSGGMDVGLGIYFALWYLGNYLYNITNKLALNAAGGKTGFPMTISSMQLGIGSLYGLFLWAAPDARAKPKVTLADIKAMLPVALCFMGAHSASVFAMGMGAVSFAQIVKAAEPAFAAVIATFVYKKKVSKAKWLCLPIVIGGEFN